MAAAAAAAGDDDESELIWNHHIRVGFLGAAIRVTDGAVLPVQSPQPAAAALESSVHIDGPTQTIRTD